MKSKQSFPFHGLVSPDSPKPAAPSPKHGVKCPEKGSSPNATLKSVIWHLAPDLPLHGFVSSKSPRPPARSPVQGLNAQKKDRFEMERLNLTSGSWHLASDPPVHGLVSPDSAKLPVPSPVHGVVPPKKDPARMPRSKPPSVIRRLTFVSWARSVRTAAVGRWADDRDPGRGEGRPRPLFRHASRATQFVFRFLRAHCASVVNVMFSGVRGLVLT